IQPMNIYNYIMTQRSKSGRFIYHSYFFLPHYDPEVNNKYNPLIHDTEELVLSEKMQRARNHHLNTHLNSLTEILASETQNEFEAALEKTKPTWTPSFRTYFENNHLEQVDQLVTNSPPTSNAAESINVAVKKWLDYKETTSTNLYASDASAIENNEETNENLNTTTTTTSSPASIFEKQSNNTVIRQSITVEEKAKMIIDQKLITFDADSKVFNIRSMDRRNCYCVHFHDPTFLLKCSCGNRLQNCSHVSAVKIYFGMHLSDRDRQINLGEARKRKRLQDKEGGSGTKCPNTADRAAAKQYKAEVTKRQKTTSTQPTTTQISPYFPAASTTSTNLNTITATFNAQKRTPFQNLVNIVPTQNSTSIISPHDLIDHVIDYVTKPPHSWPPIHGTSPNQIHQTRLLKFYNECKQNNDLSVYRPKSGNYVYRVQKSTKIGQYILVVEQNVKQLPGDEKKTTAPDKRVQNGRPPSNNSFNEYYKKNFFIVREKVDPVLDYIFKLVEFEHYEDSSSDNDEENDDNRKKNKATTAVTTPKPVPTSRASTIPTPKQVLKPSAKVNSQSKRQAADGDDQSTSVKKTKKDETSKPSTSRISGKQQRGATAASRTISPPSNSPQTTFQRTLRPRKK
ncbi:unnamed protein product, partial [Didymodactylos carnosus]